ncbi:MAG: carboxynorspermidine decarboxylase [Saprospiraceae bacterium]|nr:carboxynorspermidine decarboxylase [Saprospiraceae bacterium]
METKYSKIPSPAFVLDEYRLRKNLELMAGVQQRTGISIILALKGFALWPVFPLVRMYLKGATASSLAEARLIEEEMGVKAHTYSPAYMPDVFDDIVQHSSHITFNSLSQYERFEERITNADCSIGLRVNPEYSEVTTDLYNPAIPGSRLGVLSHQLPDTLPEKIRGLHVHTLCESSAEATERLIEVTEQKFGAHFSQLSWINFGGGHLMTRKGYDLARLEKALLSFQKRYPHLEVLLEPGSAVAWETGELVSTVLDIVESGGIKTAILDVSFTCHMPDTLEMPYRPSVLGAQDAGNGADNYIYRLGGVSCLAGDFMEAYSFDQPLTVGDKVIFWDMMHYTMVKTTMFNGVSHPAIIQQTGDEMKVLRSFGYADFKNRLG